MHMNIMLKKGYEGVMCRLHVRAQLSTLISGWKLCVQTQASTLLCTTHDTTLTAKHIEYSEDLTLSKNAAVCLSDNPTAEH